MEHVFNFLVTWGEGGREKSLDIFNLNGRLRKAQQLLKTAYMSVMNIGKHQLIPSFSVKSAEL